MSALTPQLTALALQLAALVLAAVCSVLMARLGQVVPALIQDRQVRAYVETAVQAAQQTVPLKSERYAQAARLVQQRFPAVPVAQVQATIESCVAAFKLAQPNWDTLAPEPAAAPTESAPAIPPVDPARLADAQAALAALGAALGVRDAAFAEAALSTPTVETAGRTPNAERQAPPAVQP